MNHPVKIEERKAIEYLTRHPACRHEFHAFLGWVRRERDARDRENRIRGQENMTSEAQALTKILDVCGDAATEPETTTANATARTEDSHV